MYTDQSVIIMAFAALIASTGLTHAFISGLRKKSWLRIALSIVFFFLFVAIVIAEPKSGIGFIPGFLVGIAVIILKN